MSEEVGEKKEAEVKKEPEVTSAERVTIRSYPSITVQLYILGILALILGVVEFFVNKTEYTRAFGIFFILAFFFLSIVAAFEFPETKFFLLISLIVIIILLYVLLSFMNIIPSMGGLGRFYNAINATFSSHAFIGMGISALFVVFLIWLSRRFNYWVIEPNQVIHKTGLFGKVERYPTRSMRFSIDISDVFEYLLFFRSGRLVMDFPDEKKTVVLTLVPNIKRVDRKIREILGYVEVE